MPDDYALGVNFVAKDQMGVFWSRNIRNTDKFGTSAKRNFDKASNSATRYGNVLETKVGDVMKGILGAGLIERGFTAARDQMGSFVTEAAMIERATTEFGIFMRNVEQGAKTISDLRKLGAETPLQFEDLAPAAKLLLSMRATTKDQLIPDLKMLGDTAGGSGEKLQRIAFAYAETQANSKASFQEIRQFTNAGVPMLATLADMWGVNTGEAKKMVQENKATGAEVRKAFQLMTREGGMFFKGMEKTSKDALGLWSTFQDEVVITKSIIGLQFLPVLKDYLKDSIELARSVSKWAEANKELISAEVTQWLATGKNLLSDLWPIMKAVLGVVSDLLPLIRTLSPILPVLAAGWLANKTAMAGMGLVELYTNLRTVMVATKSATVAQWAWNVAMNANPIGLIIMGLTLLGAGIVLAVENWDWLTETTTSGLYSILTVGKEVFFGILRIFTWTIGGMAKLAFNFVSWFGKVFGLETVEREFHRLSGMMDELDDKMKEEAGQNDRWRRDQIKDSLNVMHEQGKIALETQTITLKPKDYAIADAPAAAIGLEMGDLNIKTAFPQMPALNFDRFQSSELKAPGTDKDGKKMVLPPNLGGGGKVVVESVLKVDIPNAPAGTRVSITESKGTAAPAINRALVGG